jgi:hypothetical protein
MPLLQLHMNLVLLELCIGLLHGSDLTGRCSQLHGNIWSTWQLFLTCKSVCKLKDYALTLTYRARILVNGAFTCSMHCERMWKYCATICIVVLPKVLVTSHLVDVDRS